MGESAEALAREVVARLASRGLTLATCESLTGGLVGACITAIPGSSAVFRGGLVTYASEVKVWLAGVDAELVSRSGVVNAECAVQMAAGAHRRCGSDIAVACTGVAGPSEQDGQPAGTVFIAVVGQDEQRVQMHRFDGDRAAVREATVRGALEMVLAAV